MDDKNDDHPPPPVPPHTHTPAVLIDRGIMHRKLRLHVIDSIIDYHRDTITTLATDHNRTEEEEVFDNHEKKEGTIVFIYHLSTKKSWWKSSFRIIRTTPLDNTIKSRLISSIFLLPYYIIG